MEEEEDELYVHPSEQPAARNLPADQSGFHQSVENGRTEESGEELEEDESDSDIDIIIERREEPKKESVCDPTVSSVKKQPQSQTPQIDGTASVKVPTTKKDGPTRDITARPGASYPAIKTSSIDLDAQPIHEATGKPITDVDMDADFREDEKPWRRPGTDMTDYFNYGFDEFTWANYCLKQQSLRKENADSKKQMDEMQSFLSGGMPGMPGGANAGMPSMPSLNEIPPEMQQMFGQMMSQGIDPTQMDPNAFMQMMAGGGQGGGGQNFGSQQNSQQMNYGYGGGNQGRGRGRRW